MSDALKSLLNRLNGSERILRRLSELQQVVAVLRDDVHAMGRAPIHAEDTDFPVFILDGRASFAASCVPSLNKSFVVSVPKSGTYFVAEILANLGLANTGIHMAENGFDDYRPGTIKREAPDDSVLQYQLPLHKATRLLARGQFAVGHLGHTDYATACLRDFQVLVSKREVRASLISHMRYLMHPRRGVKHGSAWKGIEDDRKRMEAFMGLWASDLIAWYRSISPWTKDGSALVLPYEALLGSDGEKAQLGLLRAIAQKLGLDSGDARLLEAARVARQAKTHTRSEAPSSLAQFWSAECEKIFRDAGGGELNEYLGYPAGL